MRRSKLHEYQNSYAAAMKPFGLQRGIVGSTAKHQANSEYYKQQVSRYEEDIARLQADIEKAREGKNTILSWFGKGDLAKAKKELGEKDELIAKLKGQIQILTAEKEHLQEQHKSDWKSHATLTLLATQDLPTFGYNMIDPLKSWCWGSILFYPFKISRFS